MGVTNRNRFRKWFLVFSDMPLSYLVSESYRVVEQTAAVSAKRESSLTSTSCMDLLSSIFCSFHNSVVRYLHLCMLLSFASSKAFPVSYSVVLP